MKKLSLILLLLVSCAKHVPVREAPPVFSPDRTWAYYDDGQGGYVVLSRVGSEPATKVLCPRGNPCTVEQAGTMYIIRRLK